MQIIVAAGALCYGGCQHLVLVIARAREYANVGQKLVARCIRWSSIRYEFLDLWLSELKPCWASAVASHREELVVGSRMQRNFCINPRGVECRGIPALTLFDSKFP